MGGYLSAALKRRHYWKSIDRHYKYQRGAPWLCTSTGSLGPFKSSSCLSSVPHHRDSWTQEMEDIESASLQAALRIVPVDVFLRVLVSEFDTQRLLRSHSLFDPLRLIQCPVIGSIREMSSLRLFEKLLWVLSILTTSIRVREPLWSSDWLSITVVNLCDEDVAPGTYLQPWYPLVYNRKKIVRYTSRNDGRSM